MVPSRTGAWFGNDLRSVEGVGLQLANKSFYIGPMQGYAFPVMRKEVAYFPADLEILELLACQEPDCECRLDSCGERA